MKITKNIESEILHVMNEYWSSYLNGDLQTWASYLPGDYRNIGTTQAEIWNSKKEIVDFTEMVLDQMVGMAEARNKKTQIIPYAPYVMVHELGDMYVKAEEGWVFYAPFRLSSLLEKTTDGWKILHQHGSYPDSKTEEGEAFAFDELKAENKKLRDAIQARTIELERKNRELEIEAALEKVRSRSLAMYKTDELGEVITVVFERLKELNFPVDEGIALITFTEGSKDMMEWMYNPGFSSAMKFHLPYFDHPVLSNFWEAKIRGDDFLVKRYTVDEARSFHNHIFNHTDYKNTPEEVKAACLAAETYSTSIAIQKNTAIFINDYSDISLSENEIDILQRFSRVFEQAYIRFLDLQKAEEQALKIKLVNQENERLLHSILPQPIAEQIRSGRHNVVKRFEQVSILFADIVGFTVLSEKLQPDKVVDILNGLFSKFDDLTDQYGLEKIKTIGDAYMVAAGVPEERADHAMILFRFAQDMLRSLEEYNLASDSQMKIRIGISSGPVVAGVIGKKKFAYDLWGDSVNTAARMEAYGREGTIQVSPTSYELLKNDFVFEKMPGVNIKGKGVMDVYLWRP